MHWMLLILMSLEAFRGIRSYLPELAAQSCSALQMEVAGIYLSCVRVPHVAMACLPLFAPIHVQHFTLTVFVAAKRTAMYDGCCAFRGMLVAYHTGRKTLRVLRPCLLCSLCLTAFVLMSSRGGWLRLAAPAQRNLHPE